jgi:hypothetical protein
MVVKSRAKIASLMILDLIARTVIRFSKSPNFAHEYFLEPQILKKSKSNPSGDFGSRRNIERTILGQSIPRLSPNDTVARLSIGARAMSQRSCWTMDAREKEEEKIRDQATKRTSAHWYVECWARIRLRINY